MPDGHGYGGRNWPETFYQPAICHYGAPGSAPYLPSFHKPSLVLCGMADELTPPQLSEEMAGLLPRAELVLLDKIGHLSSLEAPEQVTQAIIRLIIRAEAD